MWSQRKHSLNAGIANLFANPMDYSEPFTSYVDKCPEKKKNDNKVLSWSYIRDSNGLWQESSSIRIEWLHLERKPQEETTRNEITRIGLRRSCGFT